MFCRKRPSCHQNQADLATWDQVQQEPVYGLDGDRQLSGASLVQAFMRNMGTWRSDAKGETQWEAPVRVRVPMRSAGTDRLVVATKPSNAVKVAEVVFVPIFGQEEVAKFLPYHAQLQNGIWTVYGTLKPNARGGTLQLKIQKKDGKVIEIWHSL